MIRRVRRLTAPDCGAGGGRLCTGGPRRDCAGRGRGRGAARRRVAAAGVAPLGACVCCCLLALLVVVHRLSRRVEHAENAVAMAEAYNGPMLGDSPQASASRSHEYMSTASALDTQSTAPAPTIYGSGELRRIVAFRKPMLTRFLLQKHSARR